MTGPEADCRLRVGIAGPLLGHHPGWVVSQGERLAEHLADDGAVVRTTSSCIGRLARAVDTVRSVWSWRRRVDLVVVMAFSGPAFVITSLTTLMAQAIQVPLVLWLHGGNLPRFARDHPRWFRAIGRRAAVVVAPSPYLLGPVLDGLGGRRPPVMIPNLVDLPTGSFTPRAPLRPRVLWMRTFHPLYRPEWAIDVLARLVNRFPDITLTMAGQDKGRLDAVRALTDSSGLAGRVHFAGFLDADQKAAAFAGHDVFLNTTTTDNAPVSLLEAAAHGLPIVSTAVGGIPDLFAHRRAALLADDPASLADAIAELLADAELATALATTAHDLAVGSTWQQVGPQWHRLFDDLVAERTDG